MKSIILDIRDLEEQKNFPLLIKKYKIKILPFYKLINNFYKLNQNRYYLLYCSNQIMSRLQMLLLKDKGFKNVDVLKI